MNLLFDMNLLHMDEHLNSLMTPVLFICPWNGKWKYKRFYVFYKNVSTYGRTFKLVLFTLGHWQLFFLQHKERPYIKNWLILLFFFLQKWCYSCFHSAHNHYHIPHCWGQFSWTSLQNLWSPFSVYYSYRFMLFTRVILRKPLCTITKAIYHTTHVVYSA